MCCRCCSAVQRKCWVVSIGVLCVVGGVLLITLWPGATESIVNRLLVLSPNSWLFRKWLNPPVQNYMYIFIFNWTNVEDARSRDVKPNFQEHGPYVFREDKSKEDIIWHDNDTMTFYNRRTWFFEEELSTGSLNDVITLPHPPTVMASKLVQNMNRYVKKIMNYTLTTEGGLLAANRTAEEWLFKGFHDPLTEFATLFLSKLVTFRLEKFGFLYGRNASKTYEGTYTIHTGQTNPKLLGELAEWRWSNQSQAFEGECGKINGSTGDIFAPQRGPEEVVSVFIPDTCRSINLFPGEKRTYRGIETVKYSTNDMSFDSGQLYPNMKCYCSANGKGCPLTGVIDISQCFFGAPVYFSLPHFLNADSSYGEAITGMRPDPEMHDFQIIIEPQLGVPLSGAANMQINMLIEPDASIELFKEIRRFYAPMIILSERGDLDENFARLIRLFFNSSAIGVGLGIALLVVGLVLLSTAVYLTYTNRWRRVSPSKTDAIEESK